jgi:hypothetical protein
VLFVARCSVVRTGHAALSGSTEIEPIPAAGETADCGPQLCVRKPRQFPALISSHSRFAFCCFRNQIVFKRLISLFLISIFTLSTILPAWLISPRYRIDLSCLFCSSVAASTKARFTLSAHLNDPRAPETII